MILFKGENLQGKKFLRVCLNSDALVERKFGQKSWQGKIEPVSGEEKLRIKPRDI